MKEEKEDSIDKLFSRGLSDPGDNASYREDDWDAMEAMLDGKKPESNVRRLIILVSTIAAMLLLIVGWLYLNPTSKPDKTDQQLVNKKPQAKTDSGKYGPPVQQLAESKSSTLSAKDSSAISASDMSRKSKSFFTLSAVTGGRSTTGINPHAYQYSAINKPDTIITGAKVNDIAITDTIITDKNTAVLAGNKAKTDTIISDKNNSLLAGNTTRKDTIITENKRRLISVVDDIKPNKKKPGRSNPTASGYAYRPTFAVSFVASPDINSVQGFSQNKVGTNAGLLLTIGVARKWTVTTGALYAAKPYMTPFANYATAYKFSTDPQSVTANCTVLDVPINVGYQVYSKGANKFSLGTGLSSYFMLRENYTYNYAGGYPAGPTSYNIRNQNKHILGVLNLNATYQREISSKFGVGVQPYLKLPLTGIGYGQVNLKSAGVAVGVTWNINNVLKPK